MKVIYVQRIERIRKIEDKVIDVKVSNAAIIAGDSIDELCDYDMICRRIAEENSLRVGKYIISEFDSGKFVRYRWTLNFRWKNRDEKVFLISDEDRKLAELANEPLTDIEKISIAIPVIEKNDLTDYVCDMVQAKVTGRSLF